jgi:hypothetical protein
MLCATMVSGDQTHSYAEVAGQQGGVGAAVTLTWQQWAVQDSVWTYPCLLDNTYIDHNPPSISQKSKMFKAQTLDMLQCTAI